MGVGEEVRPGHVDPEPQVTGPSHNTAHHARTAGGRGRAVDPGSGEGGAWGCGLSDPLVDLWGGGRGSTCV